MPIDSTQGASLIQTQVATMLIKPLEKSSVILSAPGVTISNSSEPIRFPTLTGDTNAGFVGENEEIPGSGDDLDFGEIELMPTNRKSVKALVRVSNELIRMAKTGVSTVLQNKVVSDVRSVLDDAMLTGDGADNSITGLMNIPGIETAPYDLSDPDTILDGLAFLAANEVTPTMIYMNGGDFFLARKLKNLNGDYMLQADISSPGRYLLHGVPVTTTNKLPAGKALIGNMADLAIIRDEDARVTVDGSRYLEFDQTAIRVSARYDLGLLRDESFLIMDTGA